jgi:hypothetical protein
MLHSPENDFRASAPDIEDGDVFPVGDAKPVHGTTKRKARFVVAAQHADIDADRPYRLGAQILGSGGVSHGARAHHGDALHGQVTNNLRVASEASEGARDRHVGEALRPIDTLAQARDRGSLFDGRDRPIGA